MAVIERGVDRVRHTRRHSTHLELLSFAAARAPCLFLSRNCTDMFSPGRKLLIAIVSIHIAAETDRTKRPAVATAAAAGRGGRLLMRPLYAFLDLGTLQAQAQISFAHHSNLKQQRSATYKFQIDLVRSGWTSAARLESP